MTMDGMEPRSFGGTSQPGEPSEGDPQLGPTDAPRATGRLAEDLLDQAGQYALRVMTAEEQQAFEARMVVHEDLRAETERLLRVTDELLLLPRPRAARRDLWPRIQARLAPAPLTGALLPDAQSPEAHPPDPQIWKRWHGGATPVPVASVGAAETPWEPTGVPGIEARRLFADDVHRRVTLMVRMAPGTSYPAHRHADVEECFVVQGDIDTGTVHMHAGDYQRAEKGSTHPVQTTRGGCVLLLVSSQADELV